jgi:hypothetical protein
VRWTPGPEKYPRFSQAPSEGRVEHSPADENSSTLPEIPNSADREIRSTNQEILIHGRVLIAIDQDSRILCSDDRERIQHDLNDQRVRDPVVRLIAVDVR